MPALHSQSFVAPPPGVPDPGSIEPKPDVVSDQAVDFRPSFATANVQSLYSKAHGRVGKVDYLRAQFHEHRLTTSFDCKRHVGKKESPSRRALFELPQVLTMDASELNSGSTRCNL